jgi:pimeloyl-ACP methyl ester carboxylesterase
MLVEWLSIWDSNDTVKGRFPRSYCTTGFVTTPIDAMTPYLTPDQFTYVFADLRGYGASRRIAGDYSLEEAAGDVIALADRFGWKAFSLVGYSMTGLVVQRIA